MIRSRLLGLALGAVAFASEPAHALLEIGAIGGLRADTFTPNPTGVEYETGYGAKYGGLVRLSVLPFFGLRTGAILSNRSYEGKQSVVGTGNFEYEINSLDIPINLSFDFPVVDLYAFGGVTYSMLQDKKCKSSTAGVTCNANSIKDNDVAINAGLGYRVFSLPLFSLAVEGQADIGTTEHGSTGKTRGYSANLVAWFGF